MPNQRGKDQTLLNLQVKNEFLRFLDSHIEGCGYGDRSSFIRDAVLEKLASLGIKMPRDLVASPPRARRPKVNYVEGPPTRAEATIIAVVEEALKKGNESETAPRARHVVYPGAVAGGRTIPGRKVGKDKS